MRINVRLCRMLLSESTQDEGFLCVHLLLTVSEVESNFYPLWKHNLSTQYTFVCRCTLVTRETKDIQEERTYSNEKMDKPAKQVNSGKTKGEEKNGPPGCCAETISCMCFVYVLCL
jgi:hypothetical protein